ncbi:MAG: hypothetical protein ACI95C_001286 [Pseudohongiellaceae bacterium]|jgi:hypothetical protein
MFDLNRKLLPLGLSLMVCALSPSVLLAQAGSLTSQYPELARLYNAFDVAQAGVFDSVVSINADPATQQAQMQLQMQLNMMANMSMQEMMAAGMNHGDAQMVMDSTYSDQESAARIELGKIVRGDYSVAEAANAFYGSKLPTAAAEIISRGRTFEREVASIYAATGSSMVEKNSLVNAAADRYLSEPDKAVSDTPKSADLYLRHAYMNGLKAAFPKLSGFMWSNQWLQLASLEAIVLGQVDPQFAGEVGVTMERYWNKIGSDTGMTMFPAPTEMPTVPAIAPALYSQAPRAAVIIDNLNMFEVAVADILAYPNAKNRQPAVDALIANFTDEDSGGADIEQYLTSALRGGIFNQGGPAIGALDQSERNRSRAGMDMQHQMIMSVPNH